MGEQLLVRRSAVPPAPTFAPEFLSKVSSLTQALVDAQDGYTALLDHNRRIVAVNQAWRDYANQHCRCDCEFRANFGIGADYWHDCKSLHSPGVEHNEVRQGISAVLSEQQPSFVTDYRVQNGEQAQWFQIDIRALQIPEGGFLITQRDITVQRSAAEQIASSEARYRSLFNAAQDAIFVVTDSQLLLANPSAMSLLRVERAEELIGVNPLKFVAPQFHEMALARIRSCLAANTSNPPVELRLVRSDGSQVDVESVSSPFDYRGQQAAHIVMRDISSRRVAERAFRSQYEFSEKLIQTAQFIILVLDPAGKVLRINPYMEAICGYTNEDVAGRDWFDMFVPEPLRESIRSLFLAAISDIETKGNVTPVIDHQGKERLIEWYDKTLKDNNGNVLGLLATGQDITERLALEQTQSQAAKRMALLSRHLMDVQEVTRRRLASELHDRTSPNLAAIGINIDVAAMALKTRNWEEVAMRMGDNRALLEDTTASIREICSDLRPPALDYAGLAPAIESYATQFSKRTSIRVQLDLSLAQRRLPLNLETTFFRIFQESLTNTAKHARASEILVSLNLDADPWCMTVSDNGIGFDPLAPYVDAGLGMINMREMTEFVGGRFVLDTTPGGGTRIDVQIPRQ